MPQIRYYCSHCEKSFEAEERENTECPSCFWTSSVLPEFERELQGASAGIPHRGAAGQKIFGGAAFLFDALKPLFFGLVLMAVAAAAFIFFRSHPVLFRKPSSAQNVTVNEPAKKNPAAAPGPSSPVSTQDQAVLARRLALDPKRVLSKMETEILARRAPLRTGRVEKLPGAAWTLEQYKQMLAEQQAFYKVPLPRSYRGKLQKLFEEKYLAAARAFSDGKLPEARDLWAESLAFPVYADNPERHRGVVLTMLKPFINDTLSKIGALNGMLAESALRDLEARLNEAYDRFLPLVEARNWEAAAEAADGLTALAAEFEKQAAQAPRVPPYPRTIASIDRDIGRTLFDLLEASRPAAADVSALQSDVRVKKQIIETFLPEKFAEPVENYRAGIEAIAQADWKKAVLALEKVSGPAVLARDSREKLAVLEKIRKAELDSRPVSG